ncbi:ATP synthase subunit I [Pyrinomonas sp.]|uniref:ATP synthase subunit I n=1 Tax=Pyrinomonas sp. TaxID=2080306 RepID=UPI00332C1A15
MSETTRSGSGSLEEKPERVLRRLFRSTAIVVVIAASLSAMLAPWRVTAGLALGGALALLNFHWMRASVAAVFGKRRRGWKKRASLYALRYVVTVAALVVASWLNVASPAAIVGGLCAFAVATLIEAAFQLYRAFIPKRSHR